MDERVVTLQFLESPATVDWRIGQDNGTQFCCDVLGARAATSGVQDIIVLTTAYLEYFVLVWAPIPTPNPAWFTRCRRSWSKGGMTVTFQSCSSMIVASQNPIFRVSVLCNSISGKVCILHDVVRELQ